VKRTGGATGEGYVPASYVKKLRAGSIGEGPDPDTNTTSSQGADGKGEGDSADTAVVQSDLATEAAATQAALTDQYERVLALFADRQKSLEEAIAYHDFVFEAAELEIWVEERLRTALEKDVGKDAEQVELLARKFDLFKEDVASNVTRVNRFVAGYLSPPRRFSFFFLSFSILRVFLFF
jgi:hypothetical protein